MKKFLDDLVREYAGRTSDLNYMRKLSAKGIKEEKGSMKLKGNDQAGEGRTFKEPSFRKAGVINCIK